MKNNIASLEGYRTIVFLLIFLSHSGAILHNFGALSVSCFIILSGFITYYVYEGKSIDVDFKGCISFSYKKVKRMYPLHLVMLIPAILIQVTLVIVGRLKLNIIHFFLTLIPNIFLVQSWFPQNSIYFGYNGVSWYLSTYGFLCLMFPLLFKVMKKWNIHKSIISIVFSMTILIFLSFILEVLNLQHYKEWLLYVFPPVRLIDYFMGMQIGWFFCNNKKIIKSIMITILQSITIILAVALTFFLEMNYQSCLSYDVISEPIIIYMLVVMLMTYLVATNKGIINCLFKNKILSYVGKMNIYAFLIHNLVIQYTHILMSNLLSEDVNPIILSVISLLVTYIITYIYIRINSYFVKGKLLNK